VDPGNTAGKRIVGGQWTKKGEFGLGGSKHAFARTVCLRTRMSGEKADLFPMRYGKKEEGLFLDLTRAAVKKCSHKGGGRNARNRNCCEGGYRQNKKITITFEGQGKKKDRSLPVRGEEAGDYVLAVKIPMVRRKAGGGTKTAILVKRRGLGGDNITWGANSKKRPAVTARPSL